jgi:Mlc titration factor MtfA (ptsG expression regulator)
MFHLFKRRRRAALRKEPLSEHERAIVAQNVPYVSQLTDAERQELEGLMRVFLAEKSFEGCGGLELTDEIRVTIAAQACRLLLHRETDIYPNVDAILVYPGAFRVPGKHKQGFVVIDGAQDRVGESWTEGIVVLAWDHVKADAAHVSDGRNVVLHEFAHQLDGEDGAMDGVPELAGRSRYAAWARVLGEEFGELTRRLHAGRASDIDAYGATSPAEFFAVVSEMFFEQPRAMKHRHPELYQELMAFYQQDPAAGGA